MTIDKFTEKLIAKLKQHGITIQYYHAMTTNSIYLKLDYGVLNTIRISDHKGKANLSYRYNFAKNISGTKLQRLRGKGDLPRFFAPFSRLDDMVNVILHDRDDKYKKLGGVAGYEEAMRLEFVVNDGRKGFWSSYQFV